MLFRRVDRTHDTAAKFCHFLVGELIAGSKSIRPANFLKDEKNRPPLVTLSALMDSHSRAIAHNRHTPRRTLVVPLGKKLLKRLPGDAVLSALFFGETRRLKPRNDH